MVAAVVATKVEWMGTSWDTKQVRQTVYLKASMMEGSRAD
jgi:hypothetical protein